MIRISLPVILGVLLLAASPRDTCGASVFREIHLDGPSDREVQPCKVIQVLDAKGSPESYFMDVDSVICEDGLCEIVTVRLHFDPLGNYLRYELPSGGDLTKWGHKPFRTADHDKLHQILTDPYSPLKDVEWNQITLPRSPGEKDDQPDAVSGATVLSKRNVVVVGAAYTCYTLWHWSHGAAANAVREMTETACDRQGWDRYLRSEEDQYVEFAIASLSSRKRFDFENLAAVVHVLRHGKDRLADPAFGFMEKASSETGIDYFFRCLDEELIMRVPGKRVQFLEELRDTEQEFPRGYLKKFKDWLTRADSYYEVHLLLTLMERENAPSDAVIEEAISLLGSDDSLVVRRCQRFLSAQKLSLTQQKKLEAFEG